MKCKNCVYFTGIQCHGHGEFYGSCILLQIAYKEIVNKEKILYLKTETDYMCREETECIIKKYMNWESKK